MRRTDQRPTDIVPLNAIVLFDAKCDRHSANNHKCVIVRCCNAFRLRLKNKNTVRIDREDFEWPFVLRPPLIVLIAATSIENYKQTKQTKPNNKMNNQFFFKKKNKKQNCLFKMNNTVIESTTASIGKRFIANCDRLIVNDLPKSDNNIGLLRENKTVEGNTANRANQAPNSHRLRAQSMLMFDV